MSESFWLERRAWPLSHFLVPSALYFALRDPVASLLLMYVWESVELAVYMLFRGRYVMFAGNTDTTTRETVADSLLGDPIMGGTGIALFYVADLVFSWPGPQFRVLWPGTLRFFAFLAQALPSLAVDAQTQGGTKIGAAVFGTLYVLFGALFYGIPLLRTDTTFAELPNAQETRSLAGANLGFLLALAFLQTAQVTLAQTAQANGAARRKAPSAPRDSVWMRVFLFGVVSLLAVSVAGTGTAPLVSVQ